MAVDERLVVLAHRNTQVVLTFGAQALDINELVCAATGIQCVPALSVAVHEHSLRRIETHDTTIAVLERPINHCTLTRLSKLSPGGGNVAGQPTRLLGATPQAIADSDRSPEASKG